MYFMMSLKLLLPVMVSNIFMCVWSQNVNAMSSMDIITNYNDKYPNDKTKISIISEQVQVNVYYECFCGGCRSFDSKKLKEAIFKFGDHIKINTNPYGNAKTIVDNGTVTFECQHGPEECYGNMLHACALDIIQNHTVALLYNGCMMEDSQNNRGSDDEAADKCADVMKLDADPIKKCAKGNRGTELLQRYGEESAKVNFKYVPYILVNSKLSSASTFFDDICNAFTIQPPECKQY